MMVMATVAAGTCRVCGQMDLSCRRPHGLRGAVWSRGMTCGGELREHSVPMRYMISYLYATHVSYLKRRSQGAGKVHLVHKFTALAPRSSPEVHRGYHALW